eukprot:gb/GECH01013698.1/.p1 GENE.gb/GECH01013698.1/~~gb/GECH01013698.1/.p1  ORF type:complete len:952 (+),score=246.60 gb/GECH01013698.1/:1-2856(+)
MTGWSNKRVLRKGEADDMVILEEVSEDGILNNLQNRYRNDRIYTFIGPVLISVNPFRSLPLYQDNILQEYRGRYPYELPPHVYAIAEDAYRSMLTNRENQSIIISGESGAGKTEASKVIMQYIAAVSGQDQDKNKHKNKGKKSKDPPPSTSAAPKDGQGVEYVKQQILESNPVLEAFGNAKTLRNNNSSRFGKYMEIQFNLAGDPIGGRITNYLLEKSRVVGRTIGERSFHIFYQLCRGASSSLRQELRIPSSWHQFRYLALSECWDVAAMDDAADFSATCHALRFVGVDDEDQHAVFRLLAAILHLGQVTFAPPSSPNGTAVLASSESQQSLHNAAQLLQVDAELLRTSLVTRTVAAGIGRASSYQTPLSPEQAAYARDALAKGLYGRLFEWLVGRINATMHRSGLATTEQTVIGVLDIYGFEIFDHNGFEQMSINYVNEKLQQIFIELTLKAEQDEYVREGIEWTPVDYFNNKECVNLIDQRPMGIFALLDEECLMSGTDKTFHSKVKEHLGRHGAITQVDEDRQTFTVQHYAGEVTYSVADFIDRNKDTLFPSIVALLQTSASSLISQLFSDSSGPRSKKRPPTAATQFRKQVAALTETLTACRPHYIRCIKPNAAKQPSTFHPDLVRHQVRYLGLLENVRVRRAGYAFRERFDKFVRRYKMICRDTWPSTAGEEEDRDVAQTIVKSIGLDAADGTEAYALGRSKLFIKHPETLFQLEELRDRKLHDLVSMIQSCWRSHAARRRLKELRDKAQGIFGGQKERRRISVNRVFLGDSLNLRTNPRFDVRVLQQRDSQDTRVLFSAVMEKVNRRLRVQRRTVAITDAAVINLHPRKIRVRRRLPLAEVSGLTLSPFTDGMILLHHPPTHDFLYVTDEKTEAVSTLVDQFREVTGRELPVSFSEEMPFQASKRKKRTLKIVRGNQEMKTRYTVKSSGKTVTLTIRPEPSVRF